MFPEKIILTKKNAKKTRNKNVDKRFCQKMF